MPSLRLITEELTNVLISSFKLYLVLVLMLGREEFCIGWDKGTKGSVVMQ